MVFNYLEKNGIVQVDWISLYFMMLHITIVMTKLLRYLKLKVHFYGVSVFFHMVIR